MRNCMRCIALVLLSSAPPIVGLTAKGDPVSAADEHRSSTEVIEHIVAFDEYNDVPFVKCSVNGNKAVPFMVDTGASTNILDDEYAKDLGILPTSEEYRSLQGHPMRDALIHELKIGSFRSENVPARLMKLGPVLSDDCPAKGILGYPLFRRLELCIDYPKRIVSFKESAVRRLERPFAPVFTFVIVPVLVENQGPFNFIFDTGSNKSLVDAHVLAELNPPITTRPPVVRINVEGPGEGFGWIRRGNGADGISTARDFVRRACGVRIDGTLGWRHLRDYRVAINYPTCTYQFERTGYPPESKPVLVGVAPDLSKGIRTSVKEIVFEFSVPMQHTVSYFTTFECEERWQDDRHFALTILDELEVAKEHEVILGHGFRSQKNVPLDWSPYRFKVVSDQ